MMRKIILCLVSALMICSLGIYACAANGEISDEIEPKGGYSQTTYSAAITSRTTETIKRGIVYSKVNNTAQATTTTQGGQYLEKNSYGTGMGGAKDAIEQAVGYDVDFIGYKNWQYTLEVKPYRGVSLGLNSVYLKDNLKITEKYQVWSGNSVNPTTTYTYGTAWAKGFNYHSFYVIYDDIK